jgi:hypothetical protein
LYQAAVFFASNDVDIRRLAPGDIAFNSSDRRAVIAFDDPYDNSRTTYCVEPSPDSAQNLDQSLSALLEASLEGDVVGGPGSKVGGKGELGPKNIVEIVQFFKRSQGVQNIRDVLFASCLAYSNGIMTAENFTGILSQGMVTTSILISAELAATNGLASVGSNEFQRQALDDYYRFIFESINPNGVAR